MMVDPSHNTPPVNDTPVFYLPLLDRKIFCAFHVVYNAAKGKYDKFPYDANGKMGIAAKDKRRLTDSLTVEDFLLSDGRQAYTSSPDQPGWYMGLSFYEPIIIDGKHLVCVDIDIEDGVDEKSTQYLDRFIHNMKEGGHYYERSVSGRGYHFFVLCDESQIPKTYDSKAGWKVEVFSGIGSAIKLICLSNHDIGGQLKSIDLQKEFNRYSFRSDLAVNADASSSSQSDLTASYEARDSSLVQGVTPVVEVVKTDLNDPALNIPPWTKESIKKGYSTSADGEVNKDRSAVIHGVIKDLIKCRLSDGQIVFLLTDRKYGLAEKALEKGGLKAARDWVAKQLPKHRQEVTIELEATHKRGAEDFGDVVDEIKSPYRHKSALADQWVFVTSDDGWFNIVTGQKMGSKAFNTAYKRYSPSVDIAPNGDPKPKKITNDISTYLLAYCNAAIVDDLLYMPCMDEVFQLNGLYYANSYMRNMVPKAVENWADYEAPKLIQEHLHKMFSNKAEVQTFIQWMAWVVQNPGKKVRWAPLLIGAPGDGKSQLGTVMGLAMGSLNVKVVNQTELNENFTSWKYGACLAVLEELKAVGKSRHDVSEKLKEPIANDTISVLRKGKDGFNAPNTQNYLALTNHRDAVIIEQADRRWFVMETVFSQQHKAAEGVFDGEYFKIIEASSGAIRGWLLSIDTSAFNPNRVPPSNAAKDFMKYRSKGNDATDILEMLELGGGYGYTSNVVSTDCLSKDFGVIYPQRLNTNRLSSALGELGFIKVEKLIKWRGNPRRVYVKSHFLDGCIGEDSANIRIRKELDKTTSSPNAVTSRDFERSSPYEHHHFKE